LQNVVPRVVALAQSFPWFLVIVDCGRITAYSEVMQLSELTDKEEAAPAKFEDDLAPTADHLGGKT
jgi:hypothetical protein